jgi:hypothetical protein
MYASREDWQKAMADWLAEDPTVENEKRFMVFDGAEPTVENFQGDLDVLLAAQANEIEPTWAAITKWAADLGWSILLEGTAEYDELGDAIDEADDARKEAGRIWYDDRGKITESGLYDAGGHMNAERAADWADDIRDRRKYKD